MLKATIDADIFRETIDAVSALVNECRLHVDEHGIRTITVDTSNVAMVSLEL
ncbi:MAG TPA: DNA polymerase sliding clamp, partial [Methanocorpusculum sp.]|nr:DNA polymerase sliding clamp [Methanocorpusculum sp.]